MKRIKLFGAYFFTLFFYLLLSACGGEGGEDILDLPGISSYQLEMVLVAQNNDTEVEEVSNIFPRRIRGELLDDQGQPVANQTVSVEVESARIEQSLATTNEQGIFYLSVYAGYDGEKTASAIGVYTDPNGDLATTKTHFTSQGDEPRIEFVGGDQIIIGMFDVNGNSIGTTDTPISSSNPATLIAQIGGSAIARQLVTFSSDLGVLDPSNGRALTDSQGIATIQLYAGESGGAGTASVTYTPPGDSGPVSAGINFSSLGGGVVDNLVASLSLQVISQTSGLDTTLVTGTNAGLLVATLTDSDGNALPQRVVEFSTGLGTIIPATGTALTDQNGEARVQIVAGEDEGATTIEARSGSMSASISIAIQDPLETGNSEEIIVSPTLLVEQQSGGGTTLVASNQIILGTSGTIRIQVTDLTGAPLSNRLVSLQSTLGEIYPVNGVVLTDEQGFAEALLFTDGDDLGAGELSASVTDSNGSTVTERPLSSLPRS